MAGESDDLDKLFESVADGESVDWDALEREAPDEESRALIRQLRLIAEVADVHRSQVDEVALPEDAALTTPAVGAGGVPILGAGGRRVWAGLDTTPGGGSPGGLPPAGSPPAPNLGVWGHLLLVRKIGEGSYGEVFHAHDTWLDHPVALKLLKPEAENRVSPSELLHEARKLARVRHDNVVRVHGADRHNGRVGFWMDFIDGETLAARVMKGRLSAGEATSVGQEVCRALAAVHRAKIIHRDVKAQNVMRAHDGGGIILMDFGAGEIQGDEAVGHAQGTPLYMAPELFESSAAGARTDIYAAGVLLFHLVTNAFPVNGGSMQELRDAHARGDRRRLRDERPELPDSFIAIVERAIHPDPAKRYASAGEMEAKLSGEPSTGPVSVPQPPVPVAPLPAPAAIWKWVVGGIAGGIALIAVLGFIASRFFEVVLQIDRDFWFGFADTFTIGMSGLFPYVSLWLFGAAVLGVFAALRAMLPESVGRQIARFIGWMNSADPTRVAVSVFLTGLISWSALNLFVYRDLFEALYALRDSPSNSAIDFAILGPDRNAVRVGHLLLSVYISMFLGLAVWRWFPLLEAKSVLPTARLMKWATLVVAFIVIAWDVMPRRILWETHPSVEFDNRTRFVIASTGERPEDELLLYTPDEPAQPRLRVRRNTPGLKFLNKRSLFGRKAYPASEQAR